MTTVTLKSYAKINLALDVLRKSGSMHEIQTILQEIELHDLVRVQRTESTELVIHSSEGGLAYNAAFFFATSAGIKDHIIISIEKNIPYCSGLGGSSSNAAAVLKALQHLYGSPFSDQQLHHLAAHLGMDVPFFLIGGTAFANHYGEKITPLPSLPRIPIALTLSESQKNSTKDMYSRLALDRCHKGLQKTQDLRTIISAPAPFDYDHFFSLLHNDFEDIALPLSSSYDDISSSASLVAGSGGARIFFFQKLSDQTYSMYNQDLLFTYTKA